MIARIALMVAAVLALDAGRARACMLGHHCNKYETVDVEVHDRAAGYAHAARGGIPRFSIERIAKFLQTSTWTPVVSKPPMPVGPPKQRPPTTRGGRVAHHIAPPSIRFVSADQAANAPAGAQGVLVRRIEKHGATILVEVDDRVLRLAACRRQPGFACLESTTQTLTPITDGAAP